MNKHITHPHPPQYDNKGNLICCTLEEKIDGKTPPLIAPRKEEHHEDDGHDHSHDHSHDGALGWKAYLPALISLVILLSGLAIEHLLEASFFKGWVKVIWYTIAYIPVGLPVIKEAYEALRKGEIFTEFFLMSIATIGAFAIGEYPEGVAVMLFYAIGELFQTAAVKRAKNNIKALLDVRPQTANVLRNDSYETVNPETVQIGETIQVKVGEKIPLDGVLLSKKAALNTAALTGESKPQNVMNGEKVMAGSINLDGVVELKVEKLFNDSSIARILELVQNATSRKSKTELLIRRLAKIYTPIVVYLAIAICILPYFFVENYAFTDWLYRALIFLVISCPCALVISIPLGYFGGLGAASRKGLLFKGAKIKDIEITDKFTEAEFMRLLMAVEAKSTHPIAKAILEYSTNANLPEATDILVGNKKLMEQFGVNVPSETDSIVESIVMVGIDGKFAGYVTIADELKEDAKATIQQLRATGIEQLVMLSGDKDSITQKVAAELGITNAKGGLLPEDKLNEVETIKEDPTKVVAFVGDGINDAPVLAASDIGIAMGAMGSDVAIETADIIIQTDQPSKIVTGIKIGKATQRIIWQNIALAFGVKIIVLILGAGGLATMWEAVFADVGVALLAILNAVRLQRMEWA